MTIREARLDDIPSLARIRALEWESEQFWNSRIAGYVTGKHSPKEALSPRIVYLAADREIIQGFIAGHLTRRYGCDGELQWINVIREHRGGSIAAELLLRLAGWFASKSAVCICVDVDPANAVARRFYARHGARELNRHWMVWADIRIVPDAGRADITPENPPGE